MLRERTGVYDPEDLSLLASIFDGAVAALPETMNTAENRTEIAKIILRQAVLDEGELDSLMKLMATVVSPLDQAAAQSRQRRAPGP